MRDNLAVSKCDDIAADGKVVVGHLVSYACRFQRAATFIYLVEVVSQDGGIGNLRTRRESFGHSNEPAGASLAGQQVHHRLMGILKKCLATQSLHREVGHTITQNNNVFHKRYQTPLPPGKDW